MNLTKKRKQTTKNVNIVKMNLAVILVNGNMEKFANIINLN